MKAIDGKPIEYAQFDGPCALLLCLESGPHSHPICPECKAIKFGNPGCATCRKACKTLKIVGAEGTRFV